MDRDYKGMFSKMGEGLLEKYIQDIMKELEANPKDPNLLYKLGVAYARLGKTSQAREVYKQLKDIDPNLAKDLLDLIYEV
ncbi:tetratricopeptide repeat protein [Thermocrinis minervae]|uniref:Tetratricopeptide repeat-containing protein n=1 Tax=Thermocrinis minervae TaxID=381751 RepID=A0A1M6TB19_9AQUI|nr:tetratricopeptide repeat protein [Thermocrinis minervae]SHK54193.1 Tetratricopeptide repeat-containing protein [Thermocrinis minervae]